MTPALVRAVSQAYVMSALLAATVLSPLPYALTALVLFLLHLVSVYRHYRADLNLTLTFATLLLLPLVMEPTAMGLLSSLLVIPAIPLLDHALKKNALGQELQQSEGRKTTVTLQALAGALVASLIISAVLANWSLLFASVLLIVYLLGLLAYVGSAVRRDPFLVSTSRVRVIAGNTAEASITLRCVARIRLQVHFSSPHPWINLGRDRFELGREETILGATMRPPLSGPSRPNIRALAIDPWGLIQLHQDLMPIELYVIPRTKYAEWLARKFLGEGTLGARPTVGAISLATGTVTAGHGAEYLRSRKYQAGDSLRDIDWKHLCKLNQLVIKEYGESRSMATIVAVNLTVQDAEEADNLGYRLITLVLTLAKLSVPLALAAYDRQEVILTTRAMNPREVLKGALRVAQRLSVSEQEHRFLQPPDLRRLKKNITQLQIADSDSSQSLEELLQLEYETIRRLARDHPAARAITKVAESVSPPANLAVVSGWNHDAEALAATLDRLERLGYNATYV